MTREELKKEVDMVLADLIKYVDATNEDKYNASVIDNTPYLMKTDFTIGSAVKYLSRYNTDGYKKSRQSEDLYKTIHYCLFELAKLKYESRKTFSDQIE